MLNWQSLETTGRVLSQHSARWLKLLSVGMLVTSAGCSSGQTLKNRLAPDPQLKQPVTIGSKSTTQADIATNPLPTDFPIYPQAQLSNTQTTDTGSVTTWTTAEPIDRVYAFYQQELPAKQWQLVSTPNDRSPQLTAKTETASVSIEPVAATGATQYTIALQADRSQQPTPVTTATATPSVEPSPTPSTSPTTAASADPVTGGDYLKDLVQIGAIDIPDSVNNGKTTVANRTVTRREYARWLLAANNKINGDKPSHQIKLATTTTKPVFTDVPTNHPDFISIQGLAEAGIVPSPLSGNAKAVLFRPDAPLTREQMILWKVPLDTRQALPTAAVAVIQTTWGFQDAGKIDAQARGAILADFSNGDRSNIRRAFGYTTLFQPQKPISVAEVATTLWYFGTNKEGRSAREIR
jgi:hypothetical protein